MYSKPLSRLHVISTLEAAYNNLFHCYWAIEDYEKAADNGIETLKLIHEYGEVLEVEDRFPDYYLNFVQNIQRVIEHTDRKLDAETVMMLDTLTVHLEKINSGKTEDHLP